MHLICIVIPVYNTEEYLNKCIESILNQTYKDFKLILVDDGSTDSSGNICDDYSRKDKRIHVIHKENSGRSEARNVGIDWMFRNVNCRWLTFVDSDDTIHPEYLSYLHRAIEQTNSEIAFSPIIKVDTTCEQYDELDYHCYSKPTKEVLLTFSRKMTEVSVCGKLYDVKLFENLRFPVGKLWEDLAITYKVFLSTSDCAVVDRYLYYYYINQSGTVSRNWRPKRMDEFEAYEDMLAFFKSNEEYHDLYIAYQEPYIKAISYSYYMCIHSDMPKKDIDYYGKLLSKKMRKALFMYKKNTSITFADNKEVYETAHPRLMQAYYISNVLRERLKKGK